MHAAHFSTLGRSRAELPCVLCLQDMRKRTGEQSS
jgi:hypothetical protein